MNDPQLLLLVSLASGPKHGHAMLLDIERFAGTRLGPGTLYGAITRLEESGAIEPVADDGRRRSYALTESGSALLRNRLGALERTVQTGLARVRE